MSKAKFLSAVKSDFGFCGVVYGWDSEFCSRSGCAAVLESRRGSCGRGGSAGMWPGGVRRGWRQIRRRTRIRGQRGRSRACRTAAANRRGPEGTRQGRRVGMKLPTTVAKSLSSAVPADNASFYGAVRPWGCRRLSPSVSVDTSARPHLQP
jgi:hypothetical protein